MEEKVTQNEMHKELKTGYKQGDINNLQRIKIMKACLYLKKNSEFQQNSEDPFNLA